MLVLPIPISARNFLILQPMSTKYETSQPRQCAAVLANNKKMETLNHRSHKFENMVGSMISVRVGSIATTSSRDEFETDELFKGISIAGLRGLDHETVHLLISHHGTCDSGLPFLYLLSNLRITRITFVIIMHNDRTIIL